MTQGMEFESFKRELTEFSDRVSALRTEPESSPDTLDAILLELELAEEELRVCHDELAAQTQEATESSSTANRERALLRSVFTDLAVPVFVLDHEGVVRRANRAGAALLGSATAYIAGKPFPVFIDLPARAVFRSRLSALLRNGGNASFTSVMAGPQARLRTRLMLSRLDPPSEARPLVAVAVLPPEADRPVPPRPQAEAGAGPAEADRLAVASMARHVDLISKVTRLLLDGGSFSQPVMLQRVAALLRADAADWILVDLVRGDGLTRVVAAGLGEDHAPDRPRELIPGRAVQAAPLHADVLETGKAALHPVIPDEKALGTTADGHALLTVLGAGSVLSVPLRADCATTGVLTLVRSPDRPAFGLSELRLFEDIGEHLGLALRTEHRVRRVTDVPG